MTEKIKEQIIAIRDIGVVNMFHYTAVRDIANELGYDELAVFLCGLENRRKYAEFIMFGR